MLGQSFVIGGVGRIQNQEDQVKSGDKGGWQVNILRHSLAPVKLGPDRVGSRQDGSPKKL